MSLSARLATPPAPLGCIIVKTAADLPSADGLALLSAVEGSDWGPTELAVAVADEGISISRTAISRHRDGKCPCKKAALR